VTTRAVGTFIVVKMVLLVSICQIMDQFCHSHTLNIPARCTLTALYIILHDLEDAKTTTWTVGDWRQKSEL
jgi:hypothetical protein